MKQWQKEIKQAQLDREKQVYKELEGTYRQALDDVNKKAKDLQDQISKLVADDPENESLLRSKVYQLKYQEQIKAQLDDAMNRLNDAGSIEAYMEDMYREGYASNIYALQKQGVPVIAPINHDKMLTALTYNTNNIPLSTRLYKNVEKTKKQVMSEITRGIASGMSNQDVARNIKNRMGVSYRKARQLAQNEGHRVNTQAVMDSMHDAKDRGADIVKQWDCTYDKKTRPVHARLDQKWTEIDDYFDYGGGKVFAPKQFGVASLDINCRCALLSVPRWDVDSDTPKHMDNITGELIEAKDYDDWKKKYYDVADDYDVKAEKPKESQSKSVDLTNRRKERMNNFRNRNIAKEMVASKPNFNNMNKQELEQFATNELKTQIVETKGVNVDFLRESVNVLYQFEQKMGGKTIQGLKVKFGGLPNGVYAKYDDKTNTLMLKKTGSIESFERKQMEENMKYKRKWRTDQDYYATETYSGTVWHEIGHAVDIDTNQMLSKELSKTQELDELSVKVSSYAGTTMNVRVSKRSEAWAENFSAYMDGGINKNKVPKEIVDMIERYFSDKRLS